MLSSAGLVYAACVALYEADPRRATTRLSAREPFGSKGLRLAAIALISVSTVLLGAINSFEKAVPIVIGLVALSGIACILVAEFFPKRLGASAWVTLALGALMFVITVVRTP